MTPKLQGQGVARKRVSRLMTLLLLGIASSLCTLFPAGVARAEPDDYGNPDKAGRVMLNVRGGAAFGIANTGQDVQYLGAAGIDFGIALSSGYNLYLVLTPQLDLRQNFYNVMVPLGLQYDIRLAHGLYLYPRVSLGYSAMIETASLDIGALHLSASQNTNGGIGIAELGLKAIINRSFNIGFEPLSIPVFFTNNSYAAWYRVLVFLGGTF
jgi:hypothetical protein